MIEINIAITFLVLSGKNLMIHDSIYFVPTLMVYERHLSKVVVFSGTQLSSDFLGIIVVWENVTNLEPETRNIFRYPTNHA